MSRTPTFDKKLGKARLRALRRASALGEPIFIMRGVAGFPALTEAEAKAQEWPERDILETVEPTQEPKK